MLEVLKMCFIFTDSELLPWHHETQPVFPHHCTDTGYVLILGQASVIVFFPHGFRITLSHFCLPCSCDNFPSPSFIARQELMFGHKELTDYTTGAVSS
jgi:hypothetical protein